MLRAVEPEARPESVITRKERLPHICEMDCSHVVSKDVLRSKYNGGLGHILSLVHEGSAIEKNFSSEGVAGRVIVGQQRHQAGSRGLTML